MDPTYTYICMYSSMHQRKNNVKPRKRKIGVLVMERLMYVVAEQ